jgi:hypothetical protein
MGAGDTRTDGVVTATRGRAGGGTGVDGRDGGARDVALSSSALADERVASRGVTVGVPALLPPFLGFSPEDGPATG